MPFILPKNRDLIHKEGYSACESVGDLCFVFYEYMKKVWNEEPRWTTAHRLYDFECDPMNNSFFIMVYNQVANHCELDDVAKAAGLAYKVFFNKVVMKYEDAKEIENGDIL